MTTKIAASVLQFYCDLKGDRDPDDEASLIDLVTDVLILANERGLDALAIGHAAAVHVSAETELVKEDTSWPE